LVRLANGNCRWGIQVKDGKRAGKQVFNLWTSRKRDLAGNMQTVVQFQLDAGTKIPKEFICLIC